MGKGNFSDDLKWDEGLQITERGYPVAESFSNLLKRETDTAKDLQDAGRSQARRVRQQRDVLQSDA